MPTPNYYQQPRDIIEKPKPWKIHQDHRPYNYLLNDRVDTSGIFGHDNINHSPVKRKNYVPKEETTKPVYQKIPTRYGIRAPAETPSEPKPPYLPAKPPKRIPKKPPSPQPQLPPQPIYDFLPRRNNNWVETKVKKPNVADLRYQPSISDASSDVIYPSSNYRPKTKRPMGFNYGLNQVCKF